MIWRQPRSTRTYTLFPYPSLFRSIFRLVAAFGEFLLELGDEYVVLARQFLHARGFLLGEGTCGRLKLVKLPLEVVGDVRRRDRRDEGETLGLRQLGRGRFQLLDRERLHGVDVEPVLVALGSEQVTQSGRGSGMERGGQYVK